jgi:hypothetical protein
MTSMAISASRHGRRVSTIAVAVLALAGVSASAAGAAAAKHGNPSVFLDPVPGDGGAAPDIFVTTVANTLASVLDFKVVLSNRQTLGPDDILQVYVDADRNPATGDDAGFEYVIQVRSSDAALARLLPGGKYEVVEAPSLQASSAGGAVRIEIAASDLGNTTAFGFFVRTFISGNPGPFDESPDGTGVWEYTLRTPHIASLRTTFAPRAPRAGSALRVTVASAQLASGETVPLDGVTCRATIGGKRVRGSGTGGCTLSVPRSARGKSLRLVVTGRFRDQTKSVKYALRVS